jgi:hypothetical protein
MSRKILFLLVCLLLLAVGTVVIVTAEETGGFALPWWTVDGGGGASSGGGFALWGTAGQADAGCASGGNYTLKSGFWTGCPIEKVYLPVLAR